MKIKSLLIGFCCLLVCGLSDAATKKSGSKKSALCSQEACTTDSTCECYCSVKCGPREQDEEDRPVFAHLDSEGKSVPATCYCKQQDLDEYNRHCNPNASKKIMNRRRSARRAAAQKNNA